MLMGKRYVRVIFTRKNLRGAGGEGGTDGHGRARTDTTDTTDTTNFTLPDQRGRVKQVEDAGDCGRGL